MEWKPGRPNAEAGESDEVPIFKTLLSNLAKWENINQRQRKISTCLYRSVCFSATVFDLVAFRVICQDRKTMKTQNDTPLEWVIFSCCQTGDVSSSFKRTASYLR